MSKKCVMDFHMFHQDRPDATYAIKRMYPDGTFHIFHVCENCLPICLANARRYDVKLSAKKIAEG